MLSYWCTRLNSKMFLFYYSEKEKRVSEETFWTSNFNLPAWFESWQVRVSRSYVIVFTIFIVGEQYGFSLFNQWTEALRRTRSEKRFEVVQIFWPQIKLQPARVLRLFSYIGLLRPTVTRPKPVHVFDPGSNYASVVQIDGVSDGENIRFHQIYEGRKGKRGKNRFRGRTEESGVILVDPQNPF